jgi:dipeptidyl aminopeptidase/acylaminoacyl peptidase
MHRGSLAVLLLAAVFASATSAQQPVAKKKITVKEMLAQPTFGGYQLSPDGNTVLFTRTDRDPKDWAGTSHIWLYDIASGKSFQLTSSAKGENNPRFLPDGRIAFVSNRDTKNAWWAISPSGGEATKLFEDENAPSSGTFSPDLKRVLFTEQTERPDKKEWDDKVKKKDDGYFFEKRLQFTQVFVYDAATKKKKQLTAGPLDHQGPSLSPDGKWIAYSVNKNGLTVRDANYGNNSDIYIIPADSGEARQLTTNEGPDNGAVWSPDGQWIAYSSSDHKTNSADQNDVKVIRASGGQPVNLTADLDYSASNIEWSKDGKSIYFVTAEGLTSKLYKVAATGGKPVEISFGKDFVFGDVSTSKDGLKWLVTGGTLMDPGIVYLAATDGKTPKRILADLNRVKEYDIAKAEPISWKGADGWEIEGILTYPLGYEPGKRYPLVLEIHGGPHGRYAAQFSQGAQIWASRGYAVLQGNPRGSSGRTFEFSNANQNDWGGKDFQDIMKGVDFVIEKGVADPERMGVMGGSYGGFMTFWTVTQTDRFKAAIGHAGISDWYSFFGQTDIPNLLEFGFGGLPSESKATYEKWSPIEFAARVKTPLLITHGESDQRVPIPQAEEYYRLLKKLGKNVEFLRFPREGHGIAEPVHRLFLDQEQEKWFSEYVLKKPVRPVSDN